MPTLLASPISLRTAARVSHRLWQQAMFTSVAGRRSETPWRADFLDHIGQLPSPAFSLSSLHRLSDASHAVVPRCRTVIFRGMWAYLPDNPKNPAPRNPLSLQTDLPVITTDVRMEKITELLGSASSSSQDASSPASGPGGPVEAVFWVPQTMTQWRIQGHTYVVGPDIESDAAAPVRAAVGQHMQRSNPDVDLSSWSWTKELTAHFGNLSPGMRGSFRNPAPGTPITQEPGDGLGLGQEVHDLEDAVARGNFRVIIIVPEAVDRVDLSDPKRARRWNYQVVADGPEPGWKSTELWP